MFNFGDKKVKASEVADIRRTVITKMTPIFNEYVNWYAEHGMTLPEEFAQDPTTWLNHLRTIQRAFNLAEGELNDEGEIFNAFMQGKTALVKSLEKEKQAGFKLFGKYLSEFIDPRYE